MSTAGTLSLRQRLLHRGTLLLRHKLLLVVVAATLAALVTAGAAMEYYDLRTYQLSLVNNLTTQADILGRASAAALTFDDRKVAEENLSLLKANPKITAAAIYTAKGNLFATYAPTEGVKPQFPPLPEADGSRVEGNELVVSRRIVENKEILGTIYLKSRFDLFERFKDYVGILSVVMALSLIVAVLLSSWMHSLVIKPILAISDLTRRVVEGRDYTLRARKTTDDEIGSLVDGVNDMLAEIGRRADVLEQSNRSLEHEISERRGAEEALRESERRNRTLVTAITSGVWIADGKGNFGNNQPSWTAYTGQQPQDYRGLGWQKAFEPEDRTALELAWARATRTPSLFDVELRLWHAQSQRYRYVNVRAVPVVGHEGEVREWIGTVTDVDDQRHAEEALRTLNAELERRVGERTAELEAANKELESFSYSVSHDLRAPVRAVAGFAKLMWEDHAAALDEEAKRKLGYIQSEAHRMGLLIDDLLAFSRMGRQAIRPVDIDMRTMAMSIFERLIQQQEGTRPELVIGSLPRANADRALIEHVWVNLFSNAVKFSSKRERPIVEVGAVSDEREHTYFVRDNGAGFDPRYQSKLFGVFQRLHDASEFSGTGVGLALVSRIVTRHGGRVWADGKPGDGATFYFTLPREPANGSS